MSEMIERVGKAICEALGDDWFREGTEGLHDTYGEVARAAIEAMRGPTEAMSKAGSESNGWFTVGEEEAGLCFNAMIDAALQERV